MERRRDEPPEMYRTDAATSEEGLSPGDMTEGRGPPKLSDAPVSLYFASGWRIGSLCRRERSVRKRAVASPRAVFEGGAEHSRVTVGKRPDRADPIAHMWATQ